MRAHASAFAPLKPLIPTVSRNTGQRRQIGFTLVELVCVLVILGIVGAVAMQRFIDVGSAAHKAAVAGTAAAFGSSLGLVHSLCIARSWAGRDNLPGYATGNVDFDTACYPTDTTGNANVIGNNNMRCLRTWNAILLPAPTITTAASGADYRARANNQVCTYRYLRDTSTTRQFTYDSRNGLIVVTNPN